MDAPTAGPTAGDLDEPSGVAARLAALERENAELRRRLDAAGAAPGAAPGTAPAHGAPGTERHRLRAVSAVLLILLGTLLAPVGAVAAWAQRALTDTDRYVAMVGPLASDPVVQSAIAGRLTDAVMAEIDVSALLGQVVDALEAQDLPPRATEALAALEAPLTGGVRSFVRSTADRVVRSDAFATTWVEANRVAHTELLAVMEGESGELLQVAQDGRLTIQLSGMIDLLKERLVDRGLGIAANIPTVSVTFPIMESAQLVQLQNRYGQIVALATWLPWVALGLLAAGVLVATHRMRALVVAGLALAGAMVVLGIALAVARGLYLDALTGTVTRLDAAEAVFDQTVAFLRVTLRTVGVLGLVVALAAYLGGGSASARSLRAGASRGLARVRSAGERRGVTSGPVGTWLGLHRGFVRTVVIAVAALTLLLAGDPTPGLVIGTALVAGVLVVVVELLARPPRPAQPGAPTAAGGPAL